MKYVYWLLIVPLVLNAMDRDDTDSAKQLVPFSTSPYNQLKTSIQKDPDYVIGLWMAAEIESSALRAILQDQYAQKERDNQELRKLVEDCNKAKDLFEQQAKNPWIALRSNIYKGISRTTDFLSPVVCVYSILFLHQSYCGSASIDTSALQQVLCKPFGW